MPIDIGGKAGNRLGALKAGAEALGEPARGDVVSIDEADGGSPAKRIIGKAQ